MTRRLPIVATILVLAVVAACIAAGLWNLQRAKFHQAELLQFQAASRLPPVAFPTAPTRDERLPLYRYATGNCLRIVNRRATAGENQAGEPGFAIILDCATGAEGPGMSVQVGWSKNPNATTPWTGGMVSGVITRDRRTRIRLVAASPAPGLEANGPVTPAVSVSPAQNRGYAFQFFSFAAIALIIYGLAVRKRLREEPKA
ncbi:MAG: SURF1 family cytochrome oxidase biogenesis protein [Sphingomicrobium sp.]